MKLIQTFGMAVVAVLLAASSATAQSKAVKIATEGASAPWNFIGSDGKLDGFDVDVARDLCARMKVTCEIVAQDWDGLIPALQAKKYDAIVAGMSITDERKKAIEFSTPYADSPNGFLVPKGSPLAKMPGTGETFNLSTQKEAAEKAIAATKPFLKGITPGVQASTTHPVFANAYLKGVLEIREYKTTEAHDLDLLAGRIDAVLADAATVKGTMDKPEFKDYIVVGPTITGSVQGDGIGIGLRKEDQELKKSFEEAIRAAIKDGTLGKISMKWFKIDITPRG